MTFLSIDFISRGSIRTIGRKFLGALPVVWGGFALMVLLAGCESPSASSAAPSPPGSVAALRGTAPASSTVQRSPESGDQTQATPDQPAEGTGELSQIVTIREGDGLKISFPGAPPLDTTQQVRADGVVTLESLGEVKVVGLRPKELEKLLSQRYASQLVSNEVVVTIVSSSFDVYVMGAVLRPGKIVASKPITAFQAIMEAGYDPINSNLEKVTLIREVGRAKYTYIPLNLKLVLEGKETVPFYLKPSDTLQVPKKITIF